ncbi:AAA family ATPase [Streptomyces stramineus]
MAAALVRPRDLLVLDEPEQRLDPDARLRLAELLNAEKADGVAVLLATHQAELAEAVADRVIALEDGRVIAEGTPAEVLGGLGLRG